MFIFCATNYAKNQGRILHRCGVCGARPVKSHTHKKYLFGTFIIRNRFNLKNISASATQSNAFFFHETTVV